MIGKQDFSRAINECVQRWPSLKGQLDVYYSHLSFMALEAFEKLCHRFVEDFRSMPLPKDFKEAYAEWKKENFTKDPSSIEENKYQVFSRVNCRFCGKKSTLCIEEPLGEKLKCRQCYTGLTDAQIKENFDTIYKMMVKNHDVRRRQRREKVSEAGA
jgi:hypothetical protein